MQDENLDSPLNCRPNTSFSVHFKKVKKNIKPNDFPSPPTTIRTIPRVYLPSETDNLIKIRALIGKSFSPSENTTPIRYSMTKTSRSPTRNAIKSNYLALHSRRVDLRQNFYNNTSLVNNYEEIRETSLDFVKVSIEKRKNLSYGCRIDDSCYENRRDRIIIREDTPNQRNNHIVQ